MQKEIFSLTNLPRKSGCIGPSSASTTKLTLTVTPLGFIPKYEDLKSLFQEIFQEDFSKELYQELFKFRIDAWTAKISRAIRFYKHTAPDCPEEYYDIWRSTIKKLQDLRRKFGPFIAPGAYKEIEQRLQSL